MKELERGGTPACRECYLVPAHGTDTDHSAAKRIGR
jgi:hypothetical protein